MMFYFYFCKMTKIGHNFTHDEHASLVMLETPERRQWERWDGTQGCTLSDTYQYKAWPLSTPEQKINMSFKSLFHLNLHPCGVYMHIQIGHVLHPQFQLAHLTLAFWSIRRR